MARRVGMEVSIAVSEAVKECDVDVISAYPITPQTHIVEHLSELVADGELDANFVMVESEQTAMAACCGASATGARTFTSTASQGLQLMSEIVFIASAMRLPIVMAVANRALSGPINIWGDHSDVMACRDSGWIQIFVENGQEAYDNIFVSFRVAENKNVSLPVMLNLDGFSLTHVIEPIVIMEKKDLGNYLPEYKPVVRLDPGNPVTMGPASTPGMYTEAKKAQEEALLGSRKVLDGAWKEFNKKFGREYKAVETYKAEDADTLIVTMGGAGGTATAAIDNMREKKQKVGLVKIRLFRPFPADDLREVFMKAKTVAVCDRALSIGGLGGPVMLEIKSLLYGLDNAPYIAPFIIGLGGRDIRVEHFEEIARKAIAKARDDSTEKYEIIGLKE